MGKIMKIISIGKYTLKDDFKITLEYFRCLPEIPFINDKLREDLIKFYAPNPYFVDSDCTKVYTNGIIDPVEFDSVDFKIVLPGRRFNMIFYKNKKIVFNIKKKVDI